MDANICDINHLDADVLLPPRKRLLAGFKKENPNSHGSLLDQASTSSDQPTIASSPLPLSSTSACYSSDFSTHLNSLLSSQLNNGSLSPQEILESSRSEAAIAAKSAEAARATAEEKAAIAAKAIAAANTALALVSSLSGGSRDRHLKKNKMKKHVAVQLLYKKHQPVENHRNDEALARRLHRTPRISKSSMNSEQRETKSKRPKHSNGSLVLSTLPHSSTNGHPIAGVIDSDDSMDFSLKTDTKGSRYEKLEPLEVDNGEAESSNSKVKAFTERHSPAKKRGRVKLKKLPLSICSSRDQKNAKEDKIARSYPLMEKNTGDLPVPSKPLFDVEASAEGVRSVEATPVWKCQEFKASACIKPNKVMQS